MGELASPGEIRWDYMWRYDAFPRRAGLRGARCLAGFRFAAKLAAALRCLGEFDLGFAAGMLTLLANASAAEDRLPVTSCVTLATLPAACPSRRATELKIGSRWGVFFPFLIASSKTSRSL